MKKRQMRKQMVIAAIMALVMICVGMPRPNKANAETAAPVPTTTKPGPFVTPSCVFENFQTGHSEPTSQHFTEAKRCVAVIKANPGKVPFLEGYTSELAVIKGCSWTDDYRSFETTGQRKVNATTGALIYGTEDNVCNNKLGISRVVNIQDLLVNEGVARNKLNMIDTNEKNEENNRTGSTLRHKGSNYGNQRVALYMLDAGQPITSIEVVYYIFQIKTSPGCAPRVNTVIEGNTYIHQIDMSCAQSSINQPVYTPAYIPPAPPPIKDDRWFCERHKAACIIGGIVIIGAIGAAATCVQGGQGAGSAGDGGDVGCIFKK